MAELIPEHTERKSEPHKKSFRETVNKVKERVRQVRDRVRDAKDRIKAKAKEYRDRYDKMVERHHDNQIKRADRKIERINKDVEYKNKLAESKSAKRAVKRKIAEDKIDTLNEKIKLKQAKQKYSVDSKANQRRYANVASKVIRGDDISPDELNSYKGDSNKRINFATAARTTRDPVKKARYRLESDLNSHSPAVRQQAVQTYQTMMKDAVTVKQEKLKDYQASRDRKALLGKEAIKAAGIAAAAKALIGNDDNDE